MLKHDQCQAWEEEVARLREENKKLQKKLNEKDAEIRDHLIKTKAVVVYCEPHLGLMWAARITGLLLGCDFRDAKEHAVIFFNHCEENGIGEYE